MPDFGKLLFLLGLAVAGIGALLWAGGSWFGWLGRLPGDLRIEGERGGFYFPIVTCIVISVVLSVLFAIARRFF